MNLILDFLLLIKVVILSHRDQQFEAFLVIDDFVDITGLVVYPELVLNLHGFSLVQVVLLAKFTVLFVSVEQEHHVNLHHPLDSNLVEQHICIIHCLLVVAGLSLDLVSVEELFDAFTVSHLYL